MFCNLESSEEKQGIMGGYHVRRRTSPRVHTQLSQDSFLSMASTAIITLGKTQDYREKFLPSSDLPISGIPEFQFSGMILYTHRTGKRAECPHLTGPRRVCEGVPASVASMTWPPSQGVSRADRSWSLFSHSSCLTPPWLPYLSLSRGISLAQS